MSWSTSALDKLVPLIWESLQLGAATIGSPWRTPVLGTGSDTGISLRTVVLRKADALRRSIICYSDFRTIKIEQLQHCPQAEWLFFHPSEGVQIRMRGKSRIFHQDKFAKAEWQQCPPANKGNYSSLVPPRTPIDFIGLEPSEGIPPGPASPTSSELGYLNFAVVETTVDFIDWLYLSPAGNQRANFHWDGRIFVGTSLVP